MKDIVIRKTENCDSEQHVKFANYIWKSTYAQFLPKEIIDARDLNIDERIENFGSWGLNKNSNIDYVAIVGDEIIGMLHARGISEYEHYNVLGYADLTAIYLHPDFQHMGLGKKLFELAVSEFKKQGLTKMTIGVVKDNLQARRAYEKWGGRLDTTYETYYTPMGYNLPEIFYIYDLFKINI